MVRKFGTKADQNEAWSCSGPSLVIFHGEKREQLITRYDVSQQQHQTMPIPRQFENKSPYASYGEWLLLRDSDITGEFDYCIMNPVTMQKFQLPPITEKLAYSNTTFLLYGSPVGDVGCTVYLISDDKVLYCKIGESKFTVQHLDIWIEKATIFEGMIYCITLYSCLCSAQLEDSSPLLFQECIDGSSLNNQYRFYTDFSKLIGNYNDKLLYVVGRKLDMGVVDFEVFEADFCEKVWKKLYTIGGDRSIFLDECGAFSAPVQPGCGLRVDCIYYTPLMFLIGDYHDQDPEYVTLMAYDLRDQFVTVLPPSPFQLSARSGYRRTPHQMRWINCQL